MKVFAERGFKDGSIEAIAKEVGISKALVFWYFKDKKELIREVSKKALPTEVLERCLSNPNLKGKELLKCIVMNMLLKYNDEVMRKLYVHAMEYSLIDPEIRKYVNIICDRMIKEVAKRSFCKEEIDFKEEIIVKSIYGFLCCLALQGPQRSEEEIIKGLEETLFKLVNC